MKRIVISVLFLSSLTPRFVLAQGFMPQTVGTSPIRAFDPTIDSVERSWVVVYRGDDSTDVETRGYAIATDAQGFIYVVGSADSDYVTIKYNPSGDLLWSARYNGPGNSLDRASSVAIDDSGDVIVTGFSWDSVNSVDYATVCYTSIGTQRCVARYDGSGHSYDFATDMALDPAGNIYVTGFSRDSSSPLYDFVTFKYDRWGIVQWISRYDGIGHATDHAWSIGLDSAGNVYVAGQSNSGHSFDYATVKYNSMGAEQWVTRYNGPENSEDHAWALAVDVSGNSYVTGGSGESPNYDMLTVKYNSAGVQQWTARYDGPMNWDDYGQAVKCDRSGNVYVTGYSVGVGPRAEFATIKYDRDGTQSWLTRFHAPGSTHDVPVDMVVDDASSLCLVGYSDSGDNVNYSIVKYDSAGYQAWMASYDGQLSGSDSPTAITLDMDGNVFVTGSSMMVGGPHITTLKYLQLLTTVESVPTLPAEFDLGNNYPNPFNSSTRISYSIPGTTHVSMTVYDLTGRLVSMLTEGVHYPGIYSVEFDGSSLGTGTYIVKLSGNRRTEVRLMLLVR